MNKGIPFIPTRMYVYNIKVECYQLDFPTELDDDDIVEIKKNLKFKIKLFSSEVFVI